MVQERSCLTDTGVFRFLVGRMAGAERLHVEHHLDACEDCVLLVAEAGRESAPGRTNPVATLRPCLLQPGMLLAGRYDVRRLLGRGTMGEVYEVEDCLLGRKIALKTLNAALAENAQALARLKLEVATAVRVTHPNVCRVFDLGFDRPDKEGLAILFLTMENLEGTTLARFLQEQGPLPPGQAIPILRQLADGLGAAHSAGIVHRDLKAENVMMVAAPDGGRRAVITDFGLAGSILPGPTTLTFQNAFSGTPAYAAPERLAGGRATPASDVYAFGLLSLELLTGRSSGPSDASLTLPDSPTARVAVLPRPLRRFVLRATAPNPKTRFPNGEALSAVLRALSEEGRWHKYRTRTRRIVRTAAIAAIAVAVGVIVAGRRGRDWRAAEHAVTRRSSGAVSGIGTLGMARPSAPPAADARIPEPLVPPTTAGRRRKSRAPADGLRSHAKPPVSPPQAGSSDLIRDLQLPSDHPPPPRPSSFDLIDPFAGQSGNASR